MRLPYHPAPGIGELVPGFFIVPQNPIRMAHQGVGYVPHFGEIVPGKFAVPQNPIASSLCGGGIGCSCSCVGGMCGCGSGMGSIADTINQWTSQLTSGLTTTLGGLNWKVWALAGGALVLLFMTGGGHRRRTELSAAKAEYRAKVAGIKARSPRRYQRYAESSGI